MIKLEELKFGKIEDNEQLVASVVYEFLGKYFKNNLDDFKVAEINPEYMDGISLFGHYKLELVKGINCLICEVIRRDERILVALLVPTGYRYNMSSTVKKYFDAKRVSVAPLEEVLNLTKMEYGSITPLGLPDNMPILYDPLVLESENIICGSGLQKSKILFPSKYIAMLPNANELKGLAKVE